VPKLKQNRRAAQANRAADRRYRNLDYRSWANPLCLIPCITTNPLVYEGAIFCVYAAEHYV